MRVRFGEFVLDSAARELFRGTVPVHLEPKAIALLELLLARRPAAVAKAEIRDRIWPGTFVSESNLTGLIAQLRKALADDRARARFVRTVHGFGYAFAGEAAGGPAGEPTAPAAWLVWEELVLPLQPGDNILGRGRDSSLRIEAPSVSRRHALVVVTRESATIEDLASKNGTFVAEQRIDGPTPLRDGDAVRVGDQLIVFRRWAARTAITTEIVALAQKR
jgi:hypothetical protein